MQVNLAGAELQPSQSVEGPFTLAEANFVLLSLIFTSSWILENPSRNGVASTFTFVRYQPTQSSSTSKICLHVPPVFPCPSPSPSKFYHCANGDGLFDGHSGCRTHSVHQKLRTISPMINCDGDRHGNGHDDGVNEPLFNSDRQYTFFLTV